MEKKRKRLEQKAGQSELSIKDEAPCEDKDYRDLNSKCFGKDLKILIGNYLSGLPGEKQK